ncbi:hypothetical protein DKT68_15220 [Micromonospora acroterricola]|uniref:Uncharacterized protein n=1 Tax=Micromonospora acroterricola TaxID=2202421 RepID=A0A317D7H2_9ACTN|nr:hypothetical protein [Micromonospora acroterricola]PWR08565.1 hypothetical protein DKT68_15220 [Micromonospora acroterricola]
MPGSTPTYGFPYQVNSDPPNGPALGQQLAEAVEALFVAKQPLQGTAVLSSLYTLTSTITDLPGCSITKSVPRSGAVALLTWTADCVLTVAGSTSLMAVVNVMIDGVDQAAPQSLWGPGNQAVQTNTRGTTSGSMTVVLGSSGSHTFKLRAAASSATGQIKLNAQHTQLTVLILP